MTDLFLHILSVGGAVTVVLLPLTLGHRWLEKRYAAQTRWLLALGVAAVLLIAPLLPQWAAPLTVEVPAHTVSLDRTELVLGTGVIPQVAGLPGQTPMTGQIPQSKASRSLDWTELAAIVWLGVAVVLLLLQGARYLLVRRRLLESSHPMESEEGAALRILPGLASPITLGLFHPVIFLPSADTDPMALRHEQTHIQRRDVWGKGFLFLVSAFYWFHPLVWLMARQAGRDAEAACDAQLAGRMEPEERKAYGALLLAAAGETRPIPFATRFGGSKEQMKSRLTQLFRPGKQSRMLVSGLLLAALMLSSLVACQAEPAAERPDKLPDGTYCATAMASDETGSYLVGSADAEGEDYAFIRLSLARYSKVGGPDGESLGEYTLPLSAKLTLREDDYAPGEKGTEPWKRAVDAFLHWPIYRDSVPVGEDYLILDVEDGEVVHMNWSNVIRVEAHEVVVPDAEAALQMTLTGTIPFIDSRTGTPYFIFALDDMFDMPVTVDQYTILDMDGDGGNELVLWLKWDTDECGLVLRMGEGMMYAYITSMDMMDLRTLKTDGAFRVSLGDEWWGFGCLTHDIEQIGVALYIGADENREGRYIVNGEPVTEEEFYAAVEAEEAKPNVEWYAFADVELY